MTPAQGPNSPDTEPGKLWGVEAGRGIAATLVVLFHATKYYFDSFSYWSGSALNGFFLFGHAGVEFFFVLSGYIMLKVHYPDIGQPGRARRFLEKRFTRVYPFFWLVLAVTLVLLFLNPEAGREFHREPAIILQSFVLAGVQPLASVVFVSWTLWHEVLFYAFCAAVIARPRIGLPAFAVWIALCVVIQAGAISPPWPWYLTAFINVLFAFGAASALLLRSFRIPAPRALLVLGAAIFMGTGVATDYIVPDMPEWLSHLLFGLGSTMALLGAVEAERSGRLRVPRWMIVVGSASYSIYLTHILTLSVLAKGSVALGLTQIVPAPLAFVGLAAGAVLSGIAIHFVVEKPLVQAVGKLWRRRPVPAVA